MSSLPDGQYEISGPLGFRWKSDDHQQAHHAVMEESYNAHLTRRLRRWHRRMPPQRPRWPSQRMVKRFVRKGIPDSLRVEAWMSLSDADQLMNADPKRFRRLSAVDDGPHFEQIDLDVCRTFPDNVHFDTANLHLDKENHMTNKLRRVLRAFSLSRPDPGYCQGMNYIAGMLLLVTRNEEQAFWLLHVIVDIFPDYLSSTMRGVIRDTSVCEQLLAVFDPELHQALTEKEIPVQLLLTKPMVNLYVDCLPPDTVLRIWDMLFLGDYKIVFRSAVAALIELRDFIIASDFETVMSQFIDKMQQLHDPQAFVSRALKLKIRRRELTDLRIVWEEANPET